jgi:hypothetical protein
MHDIPAPFLFLCAAVLAMLLALLAGLYRQLRGKPANAAGTMTADPAARHGTLRGRGLTQRLGHILRLTLGIAALMVLLGCAVMLLIMASGSR